MVQCARLRGQSDPLPAISLLTVFLITVTVKTMERGARAPTQKVTPARIGRGEGGDTKKNKPVSILFRVL